MSAYLRRRILDKVAAGACLAAALLAVVPLVAILGHVAVRGVGGLSIALLTEVQRPAMEGGGIAHAIVGTCLLVGLASAIGVPIGILAGVYLSELGANSFGRAVRFSADVMAGIPSIVVGVFVYTVVVIPMRGPSTLAGALALAILMIPTVTRTTEELVRLVPDSLREASLALGVPRWRSTLRVVLRTAAPGVATGVLLAIARVAGETAPLLFTAGDSSYMPDRLDQPTPSITLKIYDYATSPYEERHAQAWAAALVLVGGILVLNIVARALVRGRSRL